MIKIKCEACTITEGLVVKIMVISPEGRGVQVLALVVKRDDNTIHLINPVERLVGFVNALSTLHSTLEPGPYCYF